MTDRHIGTILDGRYRLDAILGRGGAGVVYRATQLAVDRAVAVKLLHPFLQNRGEFRARFELEAKAVGRLNHPNCVTLYDFGYSEEVASFYMVMEFIEGSSLAELLDEPVPTSTVYDISLQLAELLAHAHEQGILHRDLKPENVMLIPGGHRTQVKVLDFGLARLYAEPMLDEPVAVGSAVGAVAPASSGGRPARLTQMGQVYGTPAYMSPEQCQGARQLTPACDLYALGVMMYELFEGRMPFYDPTPSNIMQMQLHEPVPPMRSSRTPPAIAALIERLLAKLPSQRPGSAHEVVAVLREQIGMTASQELPVVSPNTGEMARLPGEMLSTPLRGARHESGVEREQPTLLDPAPRAAVATVMAPEAALSAEELEVISDSRRRNAMVMVALVALVVVVLGVTLAGGDTNEQAQAEPVTSTAPASDEADTAAAPSASGQAEQDDPAEETTASPIEAAEAGAPRLAPGADEAEAKLEAEAEAMHPKRSTKRSPPRQKKTRRAPRREAPAASERPRTLKLDGL